jgi:hypothetical protein
LNLRPSGYEPDELPGCSTPRRCRCPEHGRRMRGPRVVWVWGVAGGGFAGPGSDLLFRAYLAQYHRRWGFSRPSSGWDRVLCPPLWPPGRASPPSPRVTGVSAHGRPGLAAARGRYGWDWRVRAISTGQLAPIARLPPPAYRRGGLPRLSTRPGFEGGFPLRCVQRLSRPHLATRHCGGRHNRYTRGASLPVLSYWGERLASLEHPRQIGTELSHDVLNPAHVPL